MSRLLGSVPVYPVALAVAPVLATYVESDASVATITRPLLVATTLAVVLTVAGARVVQSRHLGGVAAVASLIALRASAIAQLAWLVLLVVAVAMVVRWLRRYLTVDFAAHRITPAGNLVGGVLLLIIAISAMVNGTVARAIDDLTRVTAVRAPPASDELPDIHILLFDSYPRADVLGRVFAHDNSEFFEGLEARGFDVSDRSRSNYANTANTLASVFNMAHLPDLDVDHQSTRRLIQESPALDIARRLGYVIHANQAPWDNVTLRSADVLCGSALPTDFELHLLSRTVLHDLLATIVPETDGTERFAAYTDTAFECLADSATSPELVLSINHFPVPHLPLVFDRHGDLVSEELAGEEVDDLSVPFSRIAPAYREQLAYLNRRTLEAVDDAIAAAGDETVVVVMSDHGPESSLREDYVDAPDVHERFTNLFAARTPGRTDLFGDAATTVNLFPGLFNAYLDTDLPEQRPSLFSPVEPFSGIERFDELPNPDVSAQSRRSQ